MSAERSPKAAGGLPEKIGRYRILGRLGKGAMGVVYSARDDLMDRKVAVKVMMGDLEADPETRARFYREAKVAGQLLHRNIVTVFELGEEEERLYMVMELLKGETLPEFLSRSDPVPLEVKVDLMMQVCEGLVVAHSRGIFHRDIKPRNLFVQKDGSLKILDFGIARIASSTMTRAGFIVGTPDYMSPEQARGQEIDQRSDIFSTAGVFYLALTGRKPFGAPDLPAILNKVQQEDPPALTEHEAPPELARIVFRALAKQLERRYQHMVEMLADLKRFRAQYDLETRHLCDQVRRRLATVESLLAERAEIASTLALPPGAVAEEDEAAVAFAGWQSRFSADALALVRLRRVELVPLATEVQAWDEELTAAIAPLRAARQAFEAGRGLLESDPRAAIVHFEQTLRCLASSAAAAEAVVRCGDLISRRQAVEDEARGLFERARAAAASDLDTAIGICTQALSLGVILPEVGGLKSELESRREHLRQERAATLERRIEAAHRALDLGDLDGADRDVLGALEMDPDDPAAQDLRQRIERARTDAAIATERARREAEEIELACAAFAAGSREEALGRLKAFVDHEPEAVAAAARLRRLEEETRRLEELERRLAQAAAQTRAAEEEAAQGWFARAVRLAESALMLDPDQPAALEVYVHAKARLCELTEIEARIAERHAGLERARDLVERRQLDEVVQIARRLVALDAEDEQATALALEVARLQWDAAVEAERRAVTAERVRVVRSALETAKATLVGRNWTSAADAAETVLGIEPQNPFALDVLRRAAAGRFGRPMPPAADDEPRELDQQIAVAGPMAPSWPRLKARVTEWAGVVRRRFQSQDGQTFTEWVMIAGLLTAICIMLLDTSQPTSIPGALIAVGRSISTYVRTMAP